MAKGKFGSRSQIRQPGLSGGTAALLAAALRLLLTALFKRSVLH
jgi:hypothetical protein